MRPTFHLALLACALYATTSLAAGWSNDSDPKPDPDYSDALAANRLGQHERAVGLLQEYLERAPKDANGQNQLAYAYRKLGKLPEALRHYQLALNLDPKHRGAHEYLGEAYIAMGDLARAEAELQTLFQLCGPGCNEYAQLKAALDTAKATGTGIGTGGSTSSAGQ